MHALEVFSVCLREGHKFPLVDDVDNEVEDGGEGCEEFLGRV